ncbi:MAG TPA: peptidylprolyl isomerase [Kiritimatiellia bacterium]|nr:peptidylprolyl isomerase [Kiritimatiellia bacterium]
MIGLLGLGVTTASWAEDDGIYADFATSLGEFTVQLDFERAPRTVASFVGLATGASGWLDAQCNVWTNKPFYDGSLFHRVVKDGFGNGIAIQGGGRISVSGGVTNLLGPGYTMLENFTNGLAHSNGVISVANSGPNTDGSQFFITATNVPFWDGGYTVFGHVTAGMDVVEAIAAVPVLDERPVDDVTVHSINIRRVNTVAEAFDISAQGVPIIETGGMRAYMSGTNLVLDYERVPQSKTLFRISEDLQAWESSDWGLGYYTSGATSILTRTFAHAELGAATFFHAARIRYPVPVTSPETQRGHTFTFWWDSPDLVYQVSLTNQPLGGGSGWVQDGTNAPYPRVVYADIWQREAYMARLSFIDDLGRQYTYHLGFNPGEATNRFTGTWWVVTNSAQRYSLSGLFTMP